MRGSLFATVAGGFMLAGGIASAQGVVLFGDARLGLGYNINNDGSVGSPTRTATSPTTFAPSPGSGSA